MTPRLQQVRRPAEIVLVVGIFLAALLVFFTAKAKIDSDEGNWIGTTRYFETYFIERDYAPDAWADGYWTRTQPMVFRYVIGSWLWLRGHDLQIQNPNYDYSKPAAANRRLGLAPSDDVLNDARQPARLMAALAAVMLYLVVRVLAGPVGGLAAAVAFIGSPYLQENLIRAKAESTLMFFLLAALLLTILSAGRLTTPWFAARWGIATGLLLGLAFGTKLTTVLALIAVAVWGIGLETPLGAWRARLAATLASRGHATLALLFGGASDRAPVAGEQVAGTTGQSTGTGVMWSDASAQPSPSARVAVWVWPLTVLAAAGFVFLVTNPFLWPDPVGRTRLLFENRRDEMAQQQKDVPSRAVHTLEHRARLVWERSVFNDQFAPSRLQLPLEAILTVVGVVWLAARALRPGRGRPRVERQVFLWVVCLWVGVTVNFGFLLQHYFVPTATLALLLSGLAIGWFVQAATALVQRWLNASPLTPRLTTDGVAVAAAPPLRAGEGVGG